MKMFLKYFETTSPQIIDSNYIYKESVYYKGNFCGAFGVFL